MGGNFCKDINNEEVYYLIWGVNFLVLYRERILLKEERI